jgi:cell wall-associated NlpC family hydrolase
MEQYDNGRHISRSDLQPGDLVFFQGTYRRGISHVGIYVGDGHFVHAANEREGVREDSLNEAYYSKHFAGARRVIFDREYTER